MIVIDKNGIILAKAIEIYRTNTDTMYNVIKIIDEGYYTANEEEKDSFISYIATQERDEYQIIDIETPDGRPNWKYLNGQFYNL